jgi:aldehyde:ferredoxin oxidoreductase
VETSTYSGKLLRVNLTNGTVKVESIPEQIRRDFLGGRGFGIKYLYDELSPGIEPLAPENKLILSTGVLCGTAGSGFSKWIAMTKSPLSGCVAKAVAGANFGPWLKFAGFDIIIIEGKAEKPSYIYLEDEKAYILAAEDLWGLNTEETQQRLKQRHGSTTETACIGPAGEKLIKYAAIVTARRSASRCGVGTVMSAKNLKAVAINAISRVVPHNPQRFKELARELIEIQRSHPRRLEYTDFGTTSLITRYSQERNMTPVRNFREGAMEGIEKLHALEFKKIKVKNFGCWGCMTRCGQIHEVTSGAYSGAWSEGPEYETLFSFGCELYNTNLASIVAADSICDLFGIDAISAGVSIGFACELFEKGIISTKDTDGLELTWGNHAAFVRLVEKIGRREGFGELLGEGVRRAAEHIGRGADKYAIHVKGIELPGYEPRAVKGFGLSYAVSNCGGIHTYGRPSLELARNIDPLAEEGKGKLVASVQKGYAIADCVLECPFANAGLTPELRNQLLVAATGIEEFGDPAYLEKVGERIVCLERAFNVREGFSRKDDTLPSRFLTEPLENAGPATGQTVQKQDTMLDEYYDAVGYTRQGIPTPQKLNELGLGGVINDIERFMK